MPSISTKLFIAVFVGGGFGSILRFAISVLFTKMRAGNFPLGTLAANLLSVIVMAVALGVFSDKMEQSEWYKALIMIGFCGGLSTFSTFSYETFYLLKTNQFLLASLNVLISVALCLIVFYFFVKKV